ncbi:membrane protein involved in the export of O-antigen and teichoic acid [Marinitoga piezophila KA3]|uniref:Membrane protein involved in the export of O-antigen and teichoic acid n=1 Tax=Marinitoga piezophila (strain DSM 14283 / JCM 11233 / KA3) TaxID=443254 RepID=H2J8A0_MARPK|nr:oligosaccharide flippase family protein [Marinitoga piezophila]AEX85584.1 membrane protein involved in the export of O-antigen and teichoic acid [Marinitoga piezophila KA3]
METSREFLKRLGAFSIGPIGAALLGFINVPLQTWLIDPTQLGKASMYSMALGISSLFIYLGFDQAFVREFNVEKDKKNLLWNSFIIPFSFSIIVMITYLYFYEPISKLLFGSVEEYIIKILAFSLPFSIFNRFNNLIIRMKEKAKLFSFIQLLNKIIGLILTIVILLFFNRNFKGIIQAQFLTLILTATITTFINYNYWFYQFKFDKELIKQLMKFGLPIIPSSIILWLLNSMDKIALRIWADFYSIGLYSAAFKIVGMIIIIQTAFLSFWPPTAYRWYENKVKIKKYEEVSNKLNSILTILFALVVLLRNYIVLLLSPEYKDATIIIPFLLFYPIMNTLSETTQIGIGFTRKTYYNILITTVAGGANIIGNFLLVPKYGALGASISTGLSYIIFFWMRTIISNLIWEKMAIKKHFISILLMVIMASLAVVYNNFGIDFIMFLLIIGYHYKEIIWGYNLAKEILLKKS